MMSFPYNFNSDACPGCRGQCCRGLGGYVWVGMDEIQAMAQALAMETDTFTRQYVRQAQGRLSLRERVINGEHLCCFFDPVDCLCTIYQSRPQQCRTFPFWNHFKDDPQKLAMECPGVILK